MDELEAVEIKANATMGVQKGGGVRSTFIAQSAGERLRLRFAVVLGLLRVARQHNIASHPGVLLLDSLKAEEFKMPMRSNSSRQSSRLRLASRECR